MNKKTSLIMASAIKTILIAYTSTVTLSNQAYAQGEKGSGGHPLDEGLPHVGQDHVPHVGEDHLHLIIPGCSPIHVGPINLPAFC